MPGRDAIRRHWIVALALALVAVAAAAPSLATAKSKQVKTNRAVADAAWGDNVTLSVDKKSFRFQSNGKPNHPVADQYLMPDPFTSCNVTAEPSCMHIEPASQAIQAWPLDITVPTRPKKVKDKLYLKAGPVGVMISGSLVYNPFEGDGKTIAMASNFTLTNAQGQEIPFVDACSAHPAPHPLGNYHYHGLPACVTSQVDTDGGPSHIIGFAFDGFPIYGQRDIDGKTVKPKELDRCNGIKSPTPEYPNGIYHYVMTDEASVQSTIRCFHGKLKQPLALFRGDGPERSKLTANAGPGQYCRFPGQLRSS